MYETKFSELSLTFQTDPRTGDLVAKLDGLPLALASAGSCLDLSGISVSKYLAHYDTSWLKLQQTTPPLLSYDQTIYSTWNLSYSYIRAENLSAANLLGLWAYIDNRDLWYDLLNFGENEAPDWFSKVIDKDLAFRSVIGTLRKHVLIEKLTESDGYAMHHCVHSWVTNVPCKASEDQNKILALACIERRISVDPA